MKKGNKMFLIAIVSGLCMAGNMNCSKENFTDLTETKVIENADFACPDRKENESAFEYNMALTNEQLEACKITEKQDGFIKLRRKRKSE